MPNWVSISMKVSGTAEDVKAFQSAMKTEESEFDFNQLVPMPPSLNIESGSIGDMGYDAFYGDATSILQYPWVKNEGIENVEQLQAYMDRTNPEYRKIAAQYFHNQMTYGCKTWYDWSNKNWGTKWNACDVCVRQEEDGLDYYFQTAWAYPFPVMEKLLERFPTLTFTGKATEESGAFAFTFINVDGAWEYTEIDIEEDEEDEE